MDFYFVYVLFSLKDEKLYIGFTAELDKRIHEHLSGRVKSTKKRLPLILIHYQAFRDKHDAKSREVFLKSGFGRNELKKALKKDLNLLKYKHLV